MAQADATTEELVRISGALDRLIADRTAGRESHTRSDAHIDQMEDFAARFMRLARGSGRSINPPIGRTANGMVW